MCGLFFVFVFLIVTGILLKEHEFIINPCVAEEKNNGDLGYVGAAVKTGASRCFGKEGKNKPFRIWVSEIMHPSTWVLF